MDYVESRAIPYKDVIYQLRDVKRKGWLLREVPRDICESVAEHSVKVAHAGFFYCIDNDGHDLVKVVDMALVHNTPEILAPDITLHDNISQKEKYRIRLAALEQITSPLGALGEKVICLWLEYAAKKTKEARLVSQLDKVDAAVQAMIYERMGYEVEEFFDDTKKKIEDKRLKDILKQMLKLRNSEADFYSIYFHLLLEK
jgi:5'-deoxynucleotidase YfbR-like HD superfamily hydrolase